jgi:DNA/RNA-binding domain of Phe-tRNA-synthetase-like protein
MEQLPFDVAMELRGWALFWAELEATGRADDALAALRTQVAMRAGERFVLEKLSSHPPVKAMRLLFRAAGTDPTKYRPSSEALLRRLIKGEAMPAINPIVDISNCLSAELAAPVCVMRRDSFTPPLLFRAGVEGEHYQSLRGPFRLYGRPLLCDADGPLDTPITGNVKVKVSGDTADAWLVAYLPAEEVTPEAAESALEKLVVAAPVVTVRRTGVS